MGHRNIFISYGKKCQMCLDITNPSCILKKDIVYLY